MSQLINRRNALAAAAALGVQQWPALAVPAVASAATSPNADPAALAVDGYLRAQADHDAFMVRFEEANALAVKHGGPRPIALIRWGNYSHIGGSEIARARAEFLAQPGADRVAIESQYRQKKAEYHALERAAKAWDQQSGMVPFLKQLDRLLDAFNDAEAALIQATPSTLSGAIILIAFVREFLQQYPGEFTGEDCWLLELIANGVSALKRIAPAVQS